MTVLSHVRSAVTNWFVWMGWTKARSTVVELVADFFVSVSIWILYAIFDLIAHRLIDDEVVHHVAHAVHACAAVATFSSLAGMGLLRVLVETQQADDGREPGAD